MTKGAPSDLHGAVKAFRPSGNGYLIRGLVAVFIAAAIFLLPQITDTTQDLWIALGAIYAIIGLSVNVITGHAGQISLGHQAFVGIGAFMAAFIVRNVGGFPTDPLTGLVLAPDQIPTGDFFIGVVVAGVTGTLMALLLGLVALRIRGLYLALITLAFGLMAETTIFNWRAFTGGGAGGAAPRPAAFASNQAYAYIALLILGVFLVIDWRLTKSRAGRAIVAIRNEERVAATLGVNVTRYKLLAFATAGFLAGVAGSLFAHWNEVVTAPDFVLQTSVVWILMSVVGGLGSRAGVVAGSAFFAVFPLALSAAVGGASIRIPLLGEVLVQALSPWIGALLLVLTITLYPGGIGQQLWPIRRFLAGGPLVESRHEAIQLGGFPALTAFAVTLILTSGAMGPRLLFGLVAAVGASVLSVLLMLEYLRQLARSAARQAARRQAPTVVSTVPLPASIVEETASQAADDGEAGDAEARPEPAPSPKGGRT